MNTDLMEISSTENWVVGITTTGFVVVTNTENWTWSNK